MIDGECDINSQTNVGHPLVDIFALETFLQRIIPRNRSPLHVISSSYALNGQNFGAIRPYFITLSYSV